MEPGLSSPEILRLTRRVEIEETDDFNAAFPARRFVFKVLKPPACEERSTLRLLPGTPFRRPHKFWG